jgi:UDP-glucose 4-epimerase
MQIRGYDLILYFYWEAAVAKVLVTGGAGFIGSHLAEALLKGGHSVVVLDDLSGGFRENLVEGVEFIQGNVIDTDLVNGLFDEHGFQFVYHLASYAADGLSHYIKRFNYTNNLIGSVNLINASINHDVKCFLFTSSVTVYGSSPILPLTENSRTHPEDPYSIAKLAVEQDLMVNKSQFDLNFIIFRPHSVYGERQNIGDRYRNVVGIFMNEILQEKPMTIFGDGSQTRAFSHIHDIVPIMAEAIDMPMAYNEIFNIGSDLSYTINELALSVAHAMGVKPNIRHLPPRNEAKNMVASHAKLQAVFGKHEPVYLDDGLRHMGEWVRIHGARQSRRFDSIEVSKNFPKAWME